MRTIHIVDRYKELMPWATFMMILGIAFAYAYNFAYIIPYTLAVAILFVLWPIVWHIARTGEPKDDNSEGSNDVPN